MAIWLPKFDAAAKFVARHRFKLMGVLYLAGDPIDRTTITDKKLRQLYENRKVLAVDGKNPVYDIENAMGWRYITKDGKRIGKGMRAPAAEAELARLTGANPVLQG